MILSRIAYVKKSKTFIGQQVIVTFSYMAPKSSISYCYFFQFYLYEIYYLGYMHQCVLICKAFIISESKT